MKRGGGNGENLRVVFWVRHGGKASRNGGRKHLGESGDLGQTGAVTGGVYLSTSSKISRTNVQSVSYREMTQKGKLLEFGGLARLANGGLLAVLSRHSTKFFGAGGNEAVHRRSLPIYPSSADFGVAVRVSGLGGRRAVYSESDGGYAGADAAAAVRVGIGGGRDVRAEAESVRIFFQ